jgi:hypothetical protein
VSATPGLIQLYNDLTALHEKTVVVPAHSVDLNINVPADRGVQVVGQMFITADHISDFYVLRTNGVPAASTFGGYTLINSAGVSSCGIFQGLGVGAHQGLVFISDGYAQSFVLTIDVEAWDPIFGGRSITVTARNVASGGCMWSTFTLDDIVTYTSIGIGIEAPTGNVFDVNTHLRANLSTILGSGL